MNDYNFWAKELKLLGLSDLKFLKLLILKVNGFCYDTQDRKK